MVSLGAYKVRYVVFWCSLVLAFLYMALPPVRYLLYTVPFLVTLTVLGDRKARIGDEARPFFALCLAGVAFAPLATSEGIKDLFFIFSGISIALFTDIPKLKAWYVFWLSLFSMALYFALVRGLHASFDFDFAGSKSTLEGSFAFVFGLLAVVALVQRRYWLVVLCAIIAVLALKRIALLGALVAAIFLFLGERRGRTILNPVVMILANTLVVIALLLYGSGAFDSHVRSLTGMSADQLGMGRETILSVPTNAIIRQPHQFVAYGLGAGHGYDHLIRFGVKENLHSDLVKIIYEYGYLIFCVFIWLMYSCRDYQLRTLFLYFNVLLVTDNTLIYSFFLVVFVAFGRLIQQTEPIAAGFSSTHLVPSRR